MFQAILKWGKRITPGDRVTDCEWFILFKLSLYIYTLSLDIAWKLPWSKPWPRFRYCLNNEFIHWDFKNVHNSKLIKTGLKSLFPLILKRYVYSLWFWECVCLDSYKIVFQVFSLYLVLNYTKPMLMVNIGDYPKGYVNVFP